MNFFKGFSFLFVFGFSAALYPNVNDYLSSIKNNPNALYAFFKEMPKGGELHYHLAGSVYPEEMLRLAGGSNYCFSNTSFIVQPLGESCNGVSSKEINADQNLYDKVIRAWSMKDFLANGESREQHFFASFSKFIPLVGDFQAKMLAITILRAANQNEHYLELIMLPKEGYLPPLSKWVYAGKNVEEKKNKLLADPGFKNQIALEVKRARDLVAETKKELGCLTSSNPKVCAVKFKFQYYILREQPLDSFFVQALLAFAVTAESEEFVGVNIVQREDSLVSLEDYSQQMAIIEFLHNLYPTVHIALHAGELSPQGVAPDDLRFHIYQAVFKGHAERIGHGLDVGFEDNVAQLLQYMAKKPVPVEINLTSNREIFEIFGKNHPLKFYLNHQVPVVLSTDDEGILRTDLTRQYVEAVINQGLDYLTLKNINRNALSYSFLPGRSIWVDNNSYKLLPKCEQLDSPVCLEFTKRNEKAEVQRRLELALEEFEKKY